MHIPRLTLADVNGVDTPGDRSTTEVLTVGGVVTGSVVDSDLDRYMIDLVAGQTYTFRTTILSGVEADPFLTLFGPTDIVLEFDDDSGPGLDASIGFRAGVTGRYYLEVSSSTGAHAEYQLSASLGPVAGGDDISSDTGTTSRLQVGQSLVGFIGAANDTDWHRVTLQAGQTYRITLDAFGASPLDDPLVTMVDPSGRPITFNDDGGEGQNAELWFRAPASGDYFVAAGAYAEGTGTYRLSLTAEAGQNPLDTIDWGTRLADPNVRIYFAAAGETAGEWTADREWNIDEINAALSAAATLAAVCGVTFTRVSTAAEASVIMVLDEDLGPETAGRMDTPPTFPAVGVFNPMAASWSFLQPGWAGYRTLIHEFGHLLGLAHPHDDGGASLVMAGVTTDFEAYGQDGLNQGVFTMMSYNRGFPTGDGLLARGYEATPMALDIAVLQAKYGAVASHTGDDVYWLPETAYPPSGYKSLWDTGGIDWIVHNGSSATIDLRAATLLSGPGGGGFVSKIDSVIGGFTIPAGVVIENARGGYHNDLLIGNDVANRLEGGGAFDRLDGGRGDDILDGGAEDDTALYAGLYADFSWTRKPDGDWRVVDMRSGAPAGTDTLHDVEALEFGDVTVLLSGAGRTFTLFTAFENIFRYTPTSEADRTFVGNLDAQVYTLQKTMTQAISEIVQRADGTTAVAAMTYQFFLGYAPSGGGFDYLVSPTGPNPNNINSAYFQFFSQENRYINFAVSVGSLGDGKPGFTADYGSLTLRQATAKAYQEIFGGSAPNEAFLNLLLDADVGNGMTRKDYFAYYGGDGLTGLGTKAAMVGWLLTEAVKADVGTMARSSNAYLTDLTDGAGFLVDLVGVYAQPDWAHNAPA